VLLLNVFVVVAVIIIIYLFIYFVIDSFRVVAVLTGFFRLPMG
jgi:hypothetical protein